jgi:hypothetical protein
MRQVRKIMSNSENVPPKSFTPLNLPRGSIRATLTLSIAFTTVYLAIFYPESLPESLRNVFIVSVAFYYSSRATFQPSAQLASQKSTTKPPLFLPTATVRISLAITTVFAIFITLMAKNEIPSFMFTVLITIVGFSLGMIVREIVTSITAYLKPQKKEARFNIKEILEHLQAATIIILVVGICLIDVINALAIFSIDIALIKILNQVLELLVGYYFGSRISRTI